MRHTATANKKQIEVSLGNLNNQATQKQQDSAMERPKTIKNPSPKITVTHNIRTYLNHQFSCCLNEASAPKRSTLV